jgi:ribosomal protein L17
VIRAWLAGWLARAPALKRVVLIQHKGDASTHARRKVVASLAEDHAAPSCHVLAAVVAHALDHRHRARVAHAEALARAAAEKGAALGRAVERRVAHNHVVVRVGQDALRAREGGHVRVADAGERRRRAAEVSARAHGVPAGRRGCAWDARASRALARATRELARAARVARVAHLVELLAREDDELAAR